MRRIPVTPLLGSVLVLLLGAGLLLLALSAWTRPLVRGEQAFREGRLEASLAHYGAAEARFDRLPWTRRLAPAAYEASRVNQFRVLYRLGRFEDLQQKASAGPARPAAHFWAGCALFRLALEETETPARLAWLRRASAEFYSALKLKSADWDTKFNYELTERLIAQLEDKDKPPPQVIELLRPRPRQGEAPVVPAG